MTQKFRSFVIFAEMRTGSNLLEATLNGLRKVTCFGEAFNPFMMGWPDKDELQGITRAEREEDPHRLLNKLFDKPGHLPGFRYFHDHDPRVLDAIIDNRDCAKIVLTRNPLESYISTRLARETNQWKLNETETAIPAATTYDPAEFRQSLDEIEAFQLSILGRLQASGQTAFWLGYEDLRDSAVMTGLLHWMGRTDIEQVQPANDQVPQNPRELAEKVTNFDEMQADLHRLDPFALRKVPNFEPRRGPSVPSFMTTEAGRGLVFMPVQGGPSEMVQGWLTALGGVGGQYTQNSLRQWKRAHPEHRSFCVLRHPLLRAWDGFLHLMMNAKPELRQLMRDVHRVPLPADEALSDLTESDAESLFGDFLGFLRRNLNGQTTLPTHPNWATQSQVVAGFARFSQPDILIRETRIRTDLEFLCHQAGIDEPRLDRLSQETGPEFLADKKLAAAARAAYLRDYIAFGFPEGISPAA
ncbi:hypothetical protein PAF17_06255 [Paracoccus sp. Z330]|uniref:Nodulation protein NodH n=1 Tax=Paracoccus onchidii TaxID=3017813 RepID=A0ABT4ZD97_9RHOB|nr:hypothetical protein [Paracoccus onchidii]MDB6177107.1 hypothetical protein [Paracoccus onchidii]